MKAVHVSVTILVLALAHAYAEDNVAQSAATSPGCGPAREKFDVTTTKNPPAAPQLDSGKALIYVIQDDTHFESRPRPTTRLGVDGTWVGATRGDSYLRTVVDAGEHHLCVSWQSFVGVGMGIKMAALHFTAEPGKTYYFRVKDKWLRDHGRGDVEFEALDTDEGQLLASKFAFSTSHPKK
jgi:hypothetical protein